MLGQKKIDLFLFLFLGTIKQNILYINMMSEYLFKLDSIINSVLFKRSNMQNLYNNKTALVLDLLYHEDDTILTDAQEHITYQLKQQLEDPLETQEDYYMLLTMKNVEVEKMHLYKAILVLTLNDEADDLTSQDINIYLLQDNWIELIKIYKYYTATELCKNCDSVRNSMIEVFEVLDKERIHNVAFKIAIKKIMRNKIYYCGLAKKLSMRDCGMY